jgi:hypothetical protein
MSTRAVRVVDDLTDALIDAGVLAGTVDGDTVADETHAAPGTVVVVVVGRVVVVVVGRVVVVVVVGRVVVVVVVGGGVVVVVVVVVGGGVVVVVVGGGVVSPGTTAAATRMRVTLATCIRPSVERNVTELAPVPPVRASFTWASGTGIEIVRQRYPAGSWNGEPVVMNGFPFTEISGGTGVEAV